MADKSQRKVSNGFLICLLAIGLISFIAGKLLPAGSFPNKAKMINTKFEEAKIASALQRHLTEAGTNFDGDWIFHALFNTNNQYHAHTNSLGETIDLWDTPYRIDFVPPTNFIIRSAGKDKIFGDADDIIFNGASNDFVKP
jgi:hypothetical protein